MIASALGIPARPGLQHRTKADLAYDFIREKIFTGELAPGERLTLASLAELTGMSHMPIREATLRLEGDGLVVSTPHKDMRVAPLLRRDAEELQQIRGVLEGLAAELACERADGGFVARLDEANEAFAAAHRDGDHSGMGEANWRFHRVVLQAAGSTQLTVSLEGIWAKCRRFRLGYRLIPGRAANTIEEHRRIMAAFTARDAAAARLAICDHVGRASVDLLALLAADEAAAAGPGR